MCGRYASTRGAGQLADFFDAVDDTGGVVEPAEELRPTDQVPIVRHSATGRAVVAVRWGLLPPWAADRRAASRMINARAETLAEARAYRGPFARRRCLVPADAWYEWRRAPELPAPLKHELAAADGRPLAFAGLYEEGSDRFPPTCTIVTTAALGRLVDVHDRMPLLLAPYRWDDWLDCAGTPDPGLLAPPGPDVLAGLTVRPVGPQTPYVTPTLF
ncbi:MAG TPA: SOS response-associated peptidase [Actinocatenispora sp.]